MKKKQKSNLIGKRKAAYDWLCSMATEITTKSDRNAIDPATFRVAAQTWMEQHILIKNLKPNQVIIDAHYRVAHRNRIIEISGGTL